MLVKNGFNNNVVIHRIKIFRSIKSPGGASSNASITSASLISPKPGSNYGHNSTGGSVRDHSPQSRGGGGRSSSGASPPTLSSGHGSAPVPTTNTLTNGGSGVPPSASPSPLSGVGSPLSRLQGMQPFDYRCVLTILQFFFYIYIIQIKYNIDKALKLVAYINTPLILLQKV